MFVLYELSNGNAHSQSSEPINNPNAQRWGVKQTNKSGLWNSELLDFEAEQKSRIMSKLEFLNLFTDEELAAILTAAKQSALVEVFIKKLDLSEFIDLAYEPTVAGLRAMSDAGLLTSDRAEAIINV